MTDKVVRVDALLYIQLGAALIGLAITAFALSADWLGMGGLPGLGVRQTLLAIAGAGLAALGITFFVSYRLYILLERWNSAVLQTTAAYIVFMVFSAGLYLAALECLLYSMHRASGSPVFAAAAQSQQGDDLDAFFKVAIFGGSAADGYNSVRKIADITDFELKRRFPGGKFLVTSFASSGKPFHRHQAELVKSVFDQYDVFLIYAGNNEGMNYLDDLGYFRKPEFKGDKSITMSNPPSGAQALVSFLQEHSRIHNIANGLFATFQEYVGDKYNVHKVSFGRYAQFSEFEQQRLLPPEEYEKLHDNFKTELEEIAALAARAEKHVIISSVPTHVLYKPFYSVLNENLADRDREALHQHLELGKERLAERDFKGALQHLLIAHEIDGRVAIVNYLIGLSYLNIGETDKGWMYLRKSKDEDGFFVRSLSSLHEISRAISLDADYVEYIDMVGSFAELYEGGLTYSDLFADIHHPSFLGHALIAHYFVKKIVEMELIDQHPVEVNSFQTPAEIIAQEDQYKIQLGVSKDLESYILFNISRWHVSIAGLSAYGEDYLDIAEEALGEFYALSRQTDEDRAQKWVFQALIEARRGHLSTALKAGQKALGASSDYTLALLYRRHLTTGDLIVDALAREGIYFAEQERHFFLADVETPRKN